MANALYDKGREAFLKGQINWIDDTIKVALVKIPSTGAAQSSDGSDYKVNIATHQFLSSVPVNAVLATETLIRSDADGHALNGIANAADLTFTNVTGKVGALIIYKQSTNGERSSSQLIAYLDTLNGLPYDKPNSDIKIQWDNGANKIFKL